MMAPVLLIAMLATGQAATLPRSTPSAQGVSAAGVLAFVDEADRSIDSLHSLMIVRHGHVVAEGWWTPYAANTPHQLYSLSKSFTSTAVGLAVAEGKLSVDDEVLKFFPDDAPPSPSANLKAMRVRDLLRMNTGQQSEPPVLGVTDKPWTAAFLAAPVEFKPGTRFVYNTPATYMLSAIVQKATGQTVLDYLKPRLFDPLGIEDATWGTSPQGISLGGYGLNVKTEDIARFGQLYLQKGTWNGQRILPEAWVDAATARQTSNGSNPNSDWDQGYGYQFWRARHNAYRGDGAFGQYCLVLPDQDAVIAITSGVRDMQAVLNLVWDKLLPAFGPSSATPDPTAEAALKDRLAKLILKTVDGRETPEIASKVMNRSFAIPANDRKIEAITLKDTPGGPTLVVKAEGIERSIVVAPKTWTRGRLAINALGEQPVAATGAWTADDTFTAKICLVETPFVSTFRLKFADDKLTFDADANVGFGPTKSATLEGRYR